MTGADYAMLGFLIAIFVVSGWFALSRRSDSPSTISPFRPLHVPVAMMSRAEIYERNAVECEREGARAAYPGFEKEIPGISPAVARDGCTGEEIGGEEGKKALKKLLANTP